MNKGRLEAFSDGVLAVIITIMVLEMKSPQGADLVALRPVIPVFLSYILSFVYIGIYWNNHHHLLHATQHVNGATLWANLHLLFWLSLVPFTTAWMGENHFESWPIAVYGTVLLLAGIAYFILTRTLIKLHGSGSPLATSIGKDRKSRISIAIYMAAIPLAFVRPWIAGACYVTVTIIWLVPDRRIERTLAK
jgi:TMEM175 potassium channel family protein